MNTHEVLATFINSRTREHREDVIVAYWYLCTRGAKKFVRAGVDWADLTQVAAIGLIKAVDNYDPHHRTPFEAYAWLLVVGELMHYVRDHERIVRVPRWLRTLEKRFARTNEVLSARFGRTPSAQELASELQIDVTVVDELRLLRRGGAIVSIQAATSSATGELPAGFRGLSLEDEVSLTTALADLADRERALVLGSFATGLSQAELGDRLGISQSQVSKLIKRALVKMHRQVA